MKKIILVVLLALSLYGDAACDFYVGEFKVSNKMLIYSIEDGNKKDALEYAKSSLDYINNVGAHCKGTKEIVKSIRETLKAKIKEWE